MTKGITGREPDPREVYADIINHPRHVSDHHPHMSLYDRAAQFAPYAALSGYDDMVKEEARQVDNRIELSEEDLEQLNRELRRIGAAIAKGMKPEISVTYFVPDPLKSGGRYETVTERIRKVDTGRQVMVLDKKNEKSGDWETIRIGEILEIHGDFQAL